MPSGEWGSRLSAPDISRWYKPFNCPAMAPQSNNSCSFMLGLLCVGGRAPMRKQLSISAVTS